MEKLQTWSYIGVAVILALVANSLSAVWAGKQDKMNLWLLAVVLISPFVFITFGLVTAKIGLTISSGTIDSLLTLSTIIVGLFLFNEWDNISVQQYIGMGFALTGIVLMQFSK